MKKRIFWQTLFAAFLFTTTAQAQSLKDLFNKTNVEKVVNSVTGKNTAGMEGTWIFSGSAIEFESDNLLKKAGGSIAATAAESKLNEQLDKMGIKKGELAFTFNADSTFNARVGSRNVKGTYSYNKDDKKVNLKFAKLMGLNATINCTTSNMDLLFNSDKLLKLVIFLANKSSNATLKSISSLAENYDGMMLGFALEKKQ